MLLIAGYVIGYASHAFFETTVWAGGLALLILVAGNYIYGRIRAKGN